MAGWMDGIRKRQLSCVPYVFAMFLFLLGLSPFCPFYSTLRYSVSSPYCAKLLISTRRRRRCYDEEEEAEDNVSALRKLCNPLKNDNNVIYERSV